MNSSKKDSIIAPEECKMMELMLRAGFSKLHPDGKYSTKKLLKLLNIDSKKRVLDIGCGPGETTIYIAKRFGRQVTGIDIMPEMIELTWRNDPSEEIVRTFSREFAEPLINAENLRGWESTFSRAGFQKVFCKAIHSMKIVTFINMWKSEEWGRKIKIVLNCLSDKEVIKRMLTIIGLLKKYPDNLGYGLYLSQK